MRAGGRPSLLACRSTGRLGTSYCCRNCAAVRLRRLRATRGWGADVGVVSVQKIRRVCGCCLRSTPHTPCNCVVVMRAAMPDPSQGTARPGVREAHRSMLSALSHSAGMGSVAHSHGWYCSTEARRGRACQAAGHACMLTHAQQRRIRPAARHCAPAASQAPRRPLRASPAGRSRRRAA
jgi:hypothetical protein